MNEFDQDALLTDAFAEFVTVAGPAVSPPGAAVARTTVMHRRKIRAAVVAVATAISVAIPITAYAALNRPTQEPAHQPTSTGSVPSTSAPASPGTASPSRPSAASKVPTLAPPDGRITITQLTHGKVRVPRFARPECPSGLVQLQRVTALTSAEYGSVGVYKIVYTNLDNDSAQETAALLTCRLGEPTERQIAAFDRAATGAIVSIGQVTADRAWTLAAAPGGGVTADVSDTQMCCGGPKEAELHQTCTYRWNGRAFVQTGGPSSFSSHAKPTDLSLQVNGASWSRPRSDGTVVGTITVTVRNKGPYASNSIVIFDEGDTTKVVARHARLAVGASVPLTLTVTKDTSNPFFNNLWLYEMGTIESGGDRSPADNRVTYPLWPNA
jgi:hypothetical protein